MALELVDNRASTAANEQLIASSSFDKYAFTRSLFMQRRAALVEAGRGKN
jgi:ABC-type transporter lipoprotein component MlaA